MNLQTDQNLFLPRPKNLSLSLKPAKTTQKNLISCKVEPIKWPRGELQKTLSQANLRAIFPAQEAEEEVEIVKLKMMNPLTNRSETSQPHQ